MVVWSEGLCCLDWERAWRDVQLDLTVPTFDWSSVVGLSLFGRLYQKVISFIGTTWLYPVALEGCGVVKMFLLRTISFTQSLFALIQSKMLDQGQAEGLSCSCSCQIVYVGWYIVVEVEAKGLKLGTVKVP